jgi:hypothetical protein
MIASLAPRERRIIALAILIGVLAALWSGLVGPLLNVGREHEDYVAKQQKLLTGYRKLASTGASLQTQLDALRASQEREAGFLDGATVALAAAKLQSDLKRLIEASGGEVKSTLNLPPLETGDFKRIGIRLDLRTNVSGLQEAIYALETFTPQLFIDKLDIRTAGSDGSADAATKEPNLTVICEVYGYLRGTQP